MENDRRANRKLAAELASRGQPLLGMLDLIGQWRLALVDLRYEAGRAQVVVLRAGESPQSGVRMRMRTRRVTRWRDADMVLRWVASAFLGTEKNFRKILRLPGPVDVESDPERIDAATRQAVAYE